MTANRLSPPRCGCMQNRQCGFSLIELMVTIGVLAIMLVIAMPAFSDFITSNRLTAQVNELLGDLRMARNEAAARSRSVRVCIAASSTSCATSGSDWAAGRIIWADTNGDGTLDASEVIKYVPALEGSVTFVASGPTNTYTLSFVPQGNLAIASAWTFTLCAPGSTTGRELALPISGRAAAKKITTCS